MHAGCDRIHRDAIPLHPVQLAHIPKEWIAGWCIRHIGYLMGDTAGRREQRYLVVDVTDRIETSEAICWDPGRGIVVIRIVQSGEVVVPLVPLDQGLFEHGEIRRRRGGDQDLARETLEPRRIGHSLVHGEIQLLDK